MLIAAAPLFFALAARVDAVAAPPPAVRVTPRPDIPWVVVVGAVDGGAAPACAAPALVEAGGSIATEPRPDGALVVAEGPPGAPVLAAVAACARGRRAAIFAEGPPWSSSLSPSPSPPPSPTSTSPSPSPAPAPAPATPAPATLGLAPTPSLLGVEGAALVLFVEDAIPKARARIEVSRGRATLVVDVADKAAARAALTAAVAQPLSPRAVDALRVRAAGVIAARRSRIGTTAREEAVRWLAFGAAEDDDGDLGTRIRARLFPAVLFGR